MTKNLHKDAKWNAIWHSFNAIIIVRIALAGLNAPEFLLNVRVVVHAMINVQMVAKIVQIQFAFVVPIRLLRM